MAIAVMGSVLGFSCYCYGTHYQNGIAHTLGPSDVPITNCLAKLNNIRVAICVNNLHN